MPFLHTFTHLLCNSVPKYVILFTATIKSNQIKIWPLTARNYIYWAVPTLRCTCISNLFDLLLVSTKIGKGGLIKVVRPRFPFFSWGLSIVSAVSPNLCVCMQYSLISQIMRSFLLHEYCFFE